MYSYDSECTEDRRQLGQLNFVLYYLSLDVSPSILQVNIRGFRNSSLTL